MFALNKNNRLTKEELISQWGDYPVDAYITYIATPSTLHPPSFLSDSFSINSPEEIAEREIDSTFSAYENMHPELKGQLTKWKVVRCEIYRGSEDCAYKAIVFCHCERIVEPD